MEGSNPLRGGYNLNEAMVDTAYPASPPVYIITPSPLSKSSLSSVSLSKDSAIPLPLEPVRCCCVTRTFGRQ
jgi:hypothetical protein